MPVWSKEELYSCRSTLFSSIPEELVENLYLKWGGIARYVLKYARDSDQQVLLNEALDISNIDSVVESFIGSGAKADAASRLIHRSVRDGFHGGPYQFVLHLLWMKFTDVSMSETENILFDSFLLHKELVKLVNFVEHYMKSTLTQLYLKVECSRFVI